MKYYSLFSWLATLLIPLALLGLSLRIVLLPLFLRVEYNMPYFPPDDYGFTKGDRLRWAPYIWNYVVNDASISYLSDLKFDDGKPVFNERELSHMDDVKRVVQGSFRVWYGSLAILLAVGAWAWLGGWWQAYLLGLMRGGWLMIGLAVTIGLVVLVGIVINPNVFWDFFAEFHSLFFEGNSWLFEYSDTLIRLFPIRFWEDAFLWAAAIALAGGLGLALGLKPK